MQIFNIKYVLIMKLPEIAHPVPVHYSVSLLSVYLLVHISAFQKANQKMSTARMC